MSVRPEPQGDHPDQEEKVADYLRRHPDFFDNHSDLLTQMRVHTGPKGAVSLVERQLTLLREQLDHNQRQLSDLLEVARENDQLNRRLHRLTLALIDAANLDEVLTGLQDELRDQFRADAVELKLFSADELEQHGNEPGPALFGDFLKAGRPSCGALAAPQLEYLFGSQAGDTASVALVPIQGGSVTAVLAIGSREPDRFHPGKGTEFLRRLGEVVSTTLRAVSAPGA